MMPLHPLLVADNLGDIETYSNRAPCSELSSNALESIIPAVALTLSPEAHLPSNPPRACPPLG